MNTEITRAVMAARYAETSAVPYARMHQVVKLLLLVQEEQPAQLSVPIQARLGFTTVRWVRAVRSGWTPARTR
ncbi:hypothetical protein [Streptomyces sp. NPDC050428]|uniref:hypothetical protein n=1 Tax=Streptomyces sp. NPDC050428 TaxID=3155757 RepID=UPI0034251E6C